MRIGWLYAPGEILKEFNIAKQAADLHSNFLCQQILHRYLVTNDLDSHIRKIVAVYRHQCRLMCDLLRRTDAIPFTYHARRRDVSYRRTPCRSSCDESL